MTTILDQIRKLEKLAAADIAGDARAHVELLKGIHNLQLVAETPIETTSRLNFQVRIVQHQLTISEPRAKRLLRMVAPTEYLHSNCD